MMRRLGWVLGTVVALLVGATALVFIIDRETPLPAASAALPPTQEQLARGRVLALAGNCAACHTARGGAPYAGGRALGTPFGTVYATNITPDIDTGIGRWTPAHFWRALHEGRGHDGRRLLPVFPYTETTRLTREDSDALYAWLRTVPPAARANAPHELRWPYDTQAALAFWRVLFFRQGEFQPDPARDREWNRGAYLVNGAGHCVACHGGRNALGGIADASFGGGTIPTRNWYAPALNRADEAGVADWPVEDIVALLRTGRSPRGWATGPMAEVVSRSTQHLPEADLRAMAVYLKSLPPAAPRVPVPPAAPADPVRLADGGKLYGDHCAACHGATGEGGATPDGRVVVPPLAGSRTVTMDPPANLVRSIALGGYGTATAADPRPYGMPPYAHVLSDEQIARVATWLRQSWGARAGEVSAFDVARWRGGSED